MCAADAFAKGTVLTIIDILAIRSSASVKPSVGQRIIYFVRRPWIPLTVSF